MKKILLFIISAIGLLSSSACHYIVVNAKVDGFWGKWQVLTSTPGDLSGSSANFIYYHSAEGEYASTSEYIWKVTIADYRKPTKKEYRKAVKEKEWFVYKGVFEYYVSDTYPDLKSQLIARGQPFVEKGSEGKKPPVKKTSDAIIKIKPFKPFWRPTEYNIYVDDVGFGIKFTPLK